MSEQAPGTTLFFLHSGSMSPRIIYLEKVRHSIAAAAKMHEPSGDATAQAYMKLVYCMAAWTGVSENAECAQALRGRDMSDGCRPRDKVSAVARYCLGGLSRSRFFKRMSASPHANEPSFAAWKCPVP